MRLRIAHSIVRRYDPPAASAIQVLRLTPRNHEGQYVIDWRIEVSADATLVAHEDAFGNFTHVFTADGPLEELSVNVDGEVETQDTGGLIRGAVERFPPSLFLRDTSLTRADRAIRDFAQQVRAASGGEASAELHALLRGLRDEIAPASVPSEPAATAAEIFARKRGGARMRPTSSSAQPAASVFPPATSPATSAPAAAQRRRATTPGPKPSFPMSAGSASIRPKAPARPTPMCVSPSASMRSAPPSRAASATAPATRRSKSRSRWTSERAGCRAPPGAFSYLSVIGTRVAANQSLPL